MKKLKTIGIIALIIMLFTTTVFAANEDVTLVKVKDNVCDIKLGEDGEVIKQLISVDNPKKEAVLQIDVKNIKSEEEQVKPSEIFLVLDNSKSMTDNKVDNTRTRKEAVFTAAKTLVEKILTAQPNTKIGIVSFSDTNLNKHLILLTEGVPNTVVGGPVNQYSGEVKTKTKATLQSVKDKGINIITVMTGVNSTFMPDQDGNVCAEAAGKTYKDLAEEIFGTQEAPNYGKFFYVTDSQVEDTITQDIFENVVTIIKNEIKDIVLVDYFPSIILANYNFEIVEQANIGKVTAEVNTENNSITWTIGVLKAGETASFKYKLVLKENFDRTIINVETPTNEKVDVTYTDTKGTEQKATSDVSPSIMLKKPKDNTQAETPIPQTGDTNIFAIIAITAIVIAMAIYTTKYMKK